MKKLSVIIALLALMLGSTVAYAAFHWCADDPVLSIGGTRVNVTVDVPEEHVDKVNGPVRVVVFVPRNIEAYVIESGNGFNGHGEEISIIQKGWARPGQPIKFEVAVQVPATKKFPVRVTILSKSKTGWSNRWVKCKAKL
jgi:hypothetical protein